MSADNIADVLHRRYGVVATAVARIDAGTQSDNFDVIAADGRHLFAKVCRPGDDLAAQLSAVELAEFARAGGVPVPAVHRDVDGDLLTRDGSTAMSLWDFVEGAEDAETALFGRRWQAVGAVVGRLHRRLATHPSAQPSDVTGRKFRSVDAARRTNAEALARYRQRKPTDEFELWVMDALIERQRFFAPLDGIVGRLPMLRAHVVHGDLSSVNLLMRGDDVAGLIDFMPVRVLPLAWEVGRIACDPRTVMLDERWYTGLPDLLAAYRDENPDVPERDLLAVPAVAAAYIGTSSYPLLEPLDHPEEVTPSLRRYARARHAAVVRMVEQLPEIEAFLRR